MPSGRAHEDQRPPGLLLNLERRYITLREHLAEAHDDMKSKILDVRAIDHLAVPKGAPTEVPMSAKWHEADNFFAAPDVSF